MDILTLLAGCRESTPKVLAPSIRAALQRIAPAEPLYLYVTPALGARPGSCYQNVHRQVRDVGGQMVEGWIAWVGGGGGYLKCVHHAVWESPQGRLVDVTPTDDVRNLFVADPGARYAGEWIKPHYFALLDNAQVLSQIEFCRFSDRMVMHPCSCGGGAGRPHSPSCEWVERAAPQAGA